MTEPRRTLDYYHGIQKEKEHEKSNLRTSHGISLGMGQDF